MIGLYRYYDRFILKIVKNPSSLNFHKNLKTLLEVKQLLEALNSY